MKKEITHEVYLTHIIYLQLDSPFIPSSAFWLGFSPADQNSCHVFSWFAHSLASIIRIRH